MSAQAFRLTGFIAYMLFPRFTSCAIPVDLLMASMVAHHILNVHFSADVGCRGLNKWSSSDSLPKIYNYVHNKNKYQANGENVRHK